MFKRIAVFIFSIILLVNLYGCALLLAGAAGGAGTATWLSGKLTEEVNADLQRTLRATRSAFKSLDLVITKEIVKDNLAQVTGDYSDGRMIWVDIHRISKTSTKVEVRVGALGDKQAASEILEKITRYL